MKLTFGGGASEVGASFLLLQIDGKNIALDCGIRMNSGNTMPDFGFLQKGMNVDCIILSHAHMDHSGALPVLSREYPRAKIFMTHATRDLTRVLLYDSIKIMEQRESEIPIYAEVHVKAMLDNIICFSPVHEFKPFNDSNIRVTFYSAGHIAGAVGVYIIGDEGSFFYSGDFSITPQRTVEGASFPRLRPDTAVFESTYGDRLHASRDIEEERLIEKIISVTGRKGKLLIPAFSLGRAQEIILLINRAFNKKQLPTGLKVYIDGMVNDICGVFNNNPNYLRTQYGKRIVKGNNIFYNDNVIAVNKNKRLRDEICSSKEGLVIISSSGMLTGGPSQWYAERIAFSEDNAIALTGYQDEEAPGRHLLDMLNGGERILKLGDKTLPINCEIGMYGLSAHADKMEIIALAHSLAAKRVFLNHGNEDVVNALGAELQKEYNGRIYIPKNGETFEITPHTKRNQVYTNNEALKTLSIDIEGMNDDEKAHALWKLIINSYGVRKAFAIEDLYYICYGCEPKKEQGFEDIKRLINNSPYFEAEKKRPFMFHMVAEEDLEIPDSHMEVNKMLALADNYFKTGLYRKGARVEEHITLLYFDFPVTAIKNYAKEIVAFQQETGWKVEINSECNLGAAEQLITSLLSPYSADMVKCSYYRDENYFQITTDKPLKDTDEIVDDFFAITGLSLRINGSGTVQELVKPEKVDGQMEQNQAFALIEEWFSNKPHKLYKKSLKVKDGIQGIELSFISPAIGELYKDDIDELEAKTYWTIWINRQSNQHDLLKIARELFAATGILCKKASFLTDKNSVQAVLPQTIDSEWGDTIKNKFTELTGVNLIIKC